MKDEFEGIRLKLKKTRIKQDLTLDELAKKCGLTKSALSRIETGKVVPRFDTLAKYAEVLGLRIWLYTIESRT